MANADDRAIEKENQRLKDKVRQLESDLALAKAEIMTLEKKLDQQQKSDESTEVFDMPNRRSTKTVKSFEIDNRS